MDANLERKNHMLVKRTMKNLTLNNMNAVYAEDREDALKLVKQLVREGMKTASGGSATLKECGIIDYLKEKTEYIDRYAFTEPEERRKAELAAFDTDYYLLSANAITEHGEIYEVDGNGNRVSALLFGPRKVIIIAGINKIVPSLRAAVERVKHTASPANCIRLGLDTFCAKTGVCVQNNFDENNLMCDKDCGDASICADTVILKRQRRKDRITVIIVGENLGY